MKDELQTKLAEILTAIQTGADKSTNFALEQLPDVVQQYLLYGRVWSAISVLACLAATTLIVWVTLRFGYLSKQTDKYGGWPELRVAATIIGSGSSLGSAGVLLWEIKYAALIWLAPKVWLLKEVAGLLK